MSDIDDLLYAQMKNPEFAKAWDETEIEDQVRRIMIKARIESELTQKELAEKSGIRQSNISRIERGACIPTLLTLNELAKGFGKRLQISFV